jgi:hypothetical protein
LAKYAFLLLLALIFIYYKKIEIKYLLPFGVLFLVLALNIIFVYKTIPLVGYFFRYLILASQVFLAGLVALLILFFKFFTENKVLFRTTTVFMFFFLVNTIFAYKFWSI